MLEDVPEVDDISMEDDPAIGDPVVGINSGALTHSSAIRLSVFLYYRYRYKYNLAECMNIINRSVL